MSGKTFLTAFAAVATMGVLAAQDPSFENPAARHVGFDLNPPAALPSLSSDKITVKFSNATVGEVLDWLKNSGINFVVDDSQIKRDRKINISVTNAEVEDFMEALASAWNGRWEQKKDIWVFHGGKNFYTTDEGVATALSEVRGLPVAPGATTPLTVHGSPHVDLALPSRAIVTQGSPMTPGQRQLFEKSMTDMQDSKKWEEFSRSMEQSAKEWSKQAEQWQKQFGNKDFKWDESKMKEFSRQMEEWSRKWEQNAPKMDFKWEQGKPMDEKAAKVYGEKMKAWAKDMAKTAPRIEYFGTQDGKPMDPAKARALADEIRAKTLIETRGLDAKIAKQMAEEMKARGLTESRVYGDAQISRKAAEEMKARAKEMEKAAVKGQVYQYYYTPGKEGKVQVFGTPSKAGTYSVLTRDGRDSGGCQRAGFDAISELGSEVRHAAPRLRTLQRSHVGSEEDAGPDAIGTLDAHVRNGRRALHHPQQRLVAPLLILGRVPFRKPALFRF